MRSSQPSRAATLLILPSLVACSFNFSLSNVFGNSMVLQRAPQRAVVWGFGTEGVAVQTDFLGQILHTTVNTDGIWKQNLPATVAGGPYNISFKSSDGSSVSLSDVLFGGK
jgi:sialate O-acetylesterase